MTKTGTNVRLITTLAMMVAALFGSASPISAQATGAAVAPATAVESVAHLAAIEEARALIQQRLEEGSPGFSVAVAINGEPVWVEGFGVADVETGTPVAPGTQFRIGSTSKSVASALAGRLVDAGTIDLHADIRETFPGFPEKRWPLTLIDLLSNQAGVRHYRGFESRNQRHFESVADGLQVFAADSLLFEPHTNVSYSSYGFNLAGAVMAHAMGMSYGDAIRQEVFAPLGMLSSAVDDPTVEMPNRASFYSRGRDGEVNPAFVVDDSYKAPSGGLVSTPTDIVRFGSALLSGMTPGGAPWISEQTRDLMFEARQTADGRSGGYALGFRIQDADPEADPAVPYAIHHGGSSVGGRSMLLMLPEYGVVVSLLTNYDGYDTKEDDAAEIARLFAGYE